MNSQLMKSLQYRKKKVKMEEYQRNIFGFSFKLQILSFEYVLTMVLTLICVGVMFGYISSIMIQIETNKLDVMRTSTIYQDYDTIPKINLFKDSILMPVLDIKVGGSIVKQFNLSQDSPGSNYWSSRDMVDINKLSKYVSVVFNAKQKQDGKSTSRISRSFRQCKPNYFSDRGYKMDPKKVAYHFCPDIEFMQNHAYVHNSYDSIDNRRSFEILVNKCNNDDPKNGCAKDEDIKKVLQDTTFTLYFVKSKVNLNKQASEDPHQIEFLFFQQFMVDLNVYRDSNNFVMHSHVIQNSNRYFNFESPDRKSLDIVSRPAWYSFKPYVSAMNLTTDGKNYNRIKIYRLAGVYFFLSNQVDVYERHLYTYITLLGHIGGIMGLIVSILKFIIKPIMFNFDIAKIIQIIYFKKRNKNKKNNSKLNQQLPSFNSLYQITYNDNDDNNNDIISYQRINTPKNSKIENSKNSNYDKEQVKSNKQVSFQFQEESNNHGYRDYTYSDQGHLNQSYQLKTIQGLNIHKNDKHKYREKITVNEPSQNESIFFKSNKFASKGLDINSPKNISNDNNHVSHQNSININRQGQFGFHKDQPNNGSSSSGGKHGIIITRNRQAAHKVGFQNNYSKVGQQSNDSKVGQQLSIEQNSYHRQRQQKVRINTKNRKSVDIPMLFQKDNVHVNHQRSLSNQNLRHIKDNLRKLRRDFHRNLCNNFKLKREKLKKFTKIKTGGSSYLNKLEYLEFTVLDIVNDLLGMKPIFYLFKNTRLVKNYDVYNALKQDLLEKLQIQKILKSVTRSKQIAKQVKILLNQVDMMEDILIDDNELSSSSESNRSIKEMFSGERQRGRVDLMTFRKHMVPSMLDDFNLDLISRHNSKPDNRHNSKPDNRHDSKPDNRHNSKSDNRHNSKPDNKHDSKHDKL